MSFVPYAVASHQTQENEGQRRHGTLAVEKRNRDETRETLSLMYLLNHFGFQSTFLMFKDNNVHEILKKLCLHAIYMTT